MKNLTFIQNTNNIIPIKSYFNPHLYKFDIYKDNAGKSGIYRWTNLTNNKAYIGSSIKLNRRLSDYYCIDRFKRIRIKGHSLIYNAILKYGITNFSLDILEYCDKNIILTREQYYINLLNPKYNICKTAGSTIGYKLSKETRVKLSIMRKGTNNPMFGKTHTNETKLLFSITRKGINNFMYGKVHTNETKLKIKTSLLKTLKTKDIKFSMQDKQRSDITKKKRSIYQKLIKNHNLVSDETKSKLSLRNQGINVKIYDTSNNLIKEFSSLKATIKYLKIGIKTIKKIMNNNLVWNKLIFKFEVKNKNKIGIFNSDNILIKISDNSLKISKLYNIPKSTLYRYIKTGKLYKNKYFFKKINN